MAEPYHRIACELRSGIAVPAGNLVASLIQQLGVDPLRSVDWLQAIHDTGDRMLNSVIYRSDICV